MKFSNLGDISSCKIVIYSDAFLGNLRNRSSQGEFLVFLERENKKFSLVYWHSSKLKSVVKGTLAAECLAELEGAEMAFLIRSVLCDILQLSSEGQVLPIFCVTDNRSLFDSVHSTKTLTDKRLKMAICILREMLYKKTIKDIRWVESKYQLADWSDKAWIIKICFVNSVE